MRKVKFRGISMCKDEHWVYGDLRHYNRNPHTEKWTIHDPEIGLETDVDENTIGQFTGLHDKNGKEIYEGDIMGLPKCDAVGIEYKNRYVRVVEWINDGFFLVEHCEMGGELRKYGDRLALEISLKSRYAGIARCFKERGLDYTVIGNIHDNPELLKGGQE